MKIYRSSKKVVWNIISIITFIILLFVNAKVSDKIDAKYGIDEKANEVLSAGKTLDH
jgi:uncharacterized membrane protein